MAMQTATILVSDVVGSTDQRIALGEERAEEVRRLHDRILTDAAERAGGTVVKGLGDGLLVLYPGASQAVSSAVAMQQSVHALGRRERLEIAIRIGISSGDVTLEGGDCFGVPVIEASRLCAAAGSGEIFAADVVTALIRGRGGHAIDRLGPFDLKGLPEPVEVHRIGWEPVRGMADLRGPAPYVGREVERKTIRDRFTAATGGTGGLVLIAGEPGIGKTRLITEVCRDVAADPGATILIGGCHDGEVRAFAPFVEAFTEWLRATPLGEVTEVLGHEAATLGRLVPAIRDALPDVGAPAELSADEAEARLNDAIGQVLARMGDRRPVVLVLDDLHWADAATVGLLRVVARRAATARLLVIGTYRDTDLDRRHPLAEALPLLRREVEPARLALQGLPVEAVQEMLQQIAEHDVPEAFAQMLASQTEGNPFFLREMLIHLVDVGVLRFEDGLWVADDQIATAIPEGIREVVGHRLSQLSEATQRVLGVGALFEVAFPLPVAADVAGLEDDAGLDAIDEALEAQVVMATETFDHYRFSHALFRQTLVGELNPSRQVRMHRSIAEALEKRLTGPPTPAQAPALAWHWQRSAALPGAERGVPSLLVVADDATARYAYREAFDAFTVALELLLDGDERAAEIHLARARAGIRVHAGTEQILADARVAAEMIAESDGHQAAASAMADLVNDAWWIDERSTSWALAAIGRRYVDDGARDRTWAVLREAELQEFEFTDAEHSGLPLDDERRRELQAVLESLSPAEVERMIFMPSSRAATEAFLAKDPPPAARLGALWGAADIAGLVAHLEGGIADAEAVGNVNMLALMNALLARCFAVAGRHDEADLAMHRAFGALPRVLPTSNAAFQTLAGASMVGFVRGRLPAAISPDQLRDLSSHPETRWVSLAVISSLAVSSADSGDIDAAVDYLDQVVVGIDLAPGYAPNYPLIACWSSLALWMLGRTDHLHVIEHNLLTKVIEPDIRCLDIPPQLAVAQLCALDGRIDEARRWATAAHDLVASEGMPTLAVQIDQFLAELELRLGVDGDPQRFHRVVGTARAAITHPAMAPWSGVFDRLERRAEVLWA